MFVLLTGRPSTKPETNRKTAAPGHSVRLVVGIPASEECDAMKSLVQSIAETKIKQQVPLFTQHCWKVGNCGGERGGGARPHYIVLPLEEKFAK